VVQVGQLRKFNHTGGVFTVVELQGKFHARGGLGKRENYYVILADGELQSGWPKSLLEDESKIVSQSPSHSTRS
jgi:hypothetical protein